MGDRRYNRAEQDLGNIVELGHVNNRIPDQRLSTLFYVSGLGLTRDPILMTSTDNMWVNVGKSQFHLPTGDAVYAPCTRTGLIVPGREALLARLSKVKRDLEGTKFSFRETNDGVDTTCPWGNRITVHEPDAARFGPSRLGMPYVEFDVPRGTADGIARFYREMIGAHANAATDERGEHARVEAGNHQALFFREGNKQNVVNKTHHIMIFVCDFSGPHGRLDARGLVSEESNEAQYRFENIVDLDTGKSLYVIDHEVRSMKNTMYGRQLVNRNPLQTARDYAAGYDFAGV
jgi:hypothetical protein